MQFIDLSEIRSNSKWLDFSSVRAFNKILLIRHARDGVTRSYVGDVKSVRKPNAYIIDLTVEVFFESGVLKPFKSRNKLVSFRNSRDISVWLISDVSTDEFQKRMVEARKAYAQARFSLKLGRCEETENFDIIGVSSNISLEEFNKVKKKIMIKYHPDKFYSQNLSLEEFNKLSEKYLAALSWVESFLLKKYNRLKLT